MVPKGDFNGTTSPFDTAGAVLGGNIWTWFIHKVKRFVIDGFVQIVLGVGASGGALADD